MKIADAKSKQKPFFDNGKTKITTKEVEGRIVEFTAYNNGVIKTFPVKNYNILAAWKQLEVFLANVKY